MAATAGGLPLLLLLVAEGSAAVGGAGAAVSVTPAPCDGSEPSACPYYFHPPADTFYSVSINNQPSFVYQAETPAKCLSGPINCARHWNVQSQSFTLASADFSRCVFPFVSVT